MASSAGRTSAPSSGPITPAGPWFWLCLLLLSPVLLVGFLGDLLAAPFVSRRHHSTFHWLLYMAARFLGPLVVMGVCAGLLVHEIRAKRGGRARQEQSQRGRQ